MPVHVFCGGQQNGKIKKLQKTLAQKFFEDFYQSVGNTKFFTEILDDCVRNDNNFELKSSKDSSVINLSIVCSD